MIEARNDRRARAAICAWLIACVAALAAFGLSAPDAIAQNAQTDSDQEVRFGDDNIAVELFTDGAPIAGETWMLALRFTPDASTDEEWHGYWSNPGDAGLGMLLQLSLPEGWEQGEALYPVPERFVQQIGDGQSLMNHIYKGAYTVLVPVEIPQGANTQGLGQVTGFVEYLACTDILCVPQDAALTSRPIGKSPSQFPRWQAEIAPLLDAEASFAMGDTVLRLAIPLPQSVELIDPHVFIGNERLVLYDKAQMFRRSTDVVTVEIPLSDWPSKEGVDPVTAVGGILSFGDQMGVRFVAEPGVVSTGGEPIVTMNSAQGAIPSLWLLLGGALLGGLILNIMPCVFPILSIKALALAKAGGDEAAARADGLAYTAGVIIACVALGGVLLLLRAGGEQVGWAFQLQSPGVVIALLILAIGITMNFAGLFELPQLRVKGGSGRTGSFAAGLLAAFVATPCTGPFMAAALGAALLLPPASALLLFAALGLGLALPFLVIGFVPALRRMLPKPGAWMERFRNWMALPMGLTALALFWLTIQLSGRGFAIMALVVCFGIVLAFYVVGRLQKAGKMSWPAWGLIATPFLVFGAFALPYSYEPQASNVAAESIHSPQEFSAETLAEARASGQPIFLWFTADWCVTCKVNEAAAIEREEVRAAFEEAGVIAIVGDWTQRDAAIGQYISDSGAAGVPLYIWYEAGAEAEQLPQVLTADILSERAARPR